MMAGIGFRLRALSEQDNLLAPVASIGHSAVIAAGPWMFTVTALGLISVLSAEPVTDATIDGFRLIVIYAFAVSLVVTAPIVLTASRLVGDAIYARDFGRVRSLLVGASALSAVASGSIGLLLYGTVFHLPAASTLAATSCCGLVSLIWVALSFCGAVRDYRGITLGFLTGLGIAVPTTAAAAHWSGDWNAMVWAFDAGLMFVLASLISRVIATFPDPTTDLVEAIASILDGLRRHKALAVGGVLAAVSLWIDKWVIWCGPQGVSHDMGLVHAPLYDSAMFTAYLTIIPALALFVAHIETSFHTRYWAYYRAIACHATLGCIEREMEALKQTTLAALMNIAMIQGALCVIVMLCAPIIVQTAGLLFLQVGILRLGALGGLFQFLFFAATSLLLFFDRQGRFMALQAIFLLLQAGFAIATLQLGPAYYGMGYLAACVISAALALTVLERTIGDLTYITFVLSNVRRPTPAPLAKRLRRMLRRHLQV